VTGAEGAIQQDGETGRKAAEAGRNVPHGMWVGSMSGLLFGTSLTAMRVGGGLGAALGLAWAVSRHNRELKLEPGTHIEMAIPRSVALDAARLPGRQFSTAE
jgi:hypothetical protein